MKEKVLCVDDEPNILQAYQRGLRKEFHIDVAEGGEQGMAALTARGPFAVVVSDMRMPGMDGVQFLSKVRDHAPDTVRMMLTGNADQQTAIDAVNEGHIFRFLNKPCPPETLAKALIAGIQQHHLLTAEKELLEKTLSGSVQILIDVLGLVNPTAFSRAARVRTLVRRLAAELKVAGGWQAEVATMLSQVGCVTIPEETLIKTYRGQSLTAEESKMFQAHPQVGHDLIARIPRLDQVAEIILYQEKLYNGAGWPEDERRGEAIPIGSRILKIALDFDKLLAKGVGAAQAFAEIRRRDEWYDPEVVEALRGILAEEIKYEPRSVRVSQLTLDMVLADDIVSTKGLLLIAKSQEMTWFLRQRLENFVAKGIITEPINVMIPLSVRT